MECRSKTSPIAININMDPTGINEEIVHKSVIKCNPQGKKDKRR
jgi:hypothetical protein